MAAIQVGISVYKQKSIHVRNCVESCLAQDGVDFIIDLRLDGPDACDEPLKKWLFHKANNHKNLRIHLGAQNEGTYGSYKWIFAQNKSKYLCQLDADDLLAPGALKLCHSFLEQNQSCSFLYTNCLNIDEEGCPIGLNHRQQTQYSYDKILTSFMTFHLRLVNREYYDKVGGYDQTLKCVGDYDLCLKLSEKAPVYFLDRPLYYYRLSSTNFSRIAKEQLEEEVLLVCRKSLKRRKLDSFFEIRSGPQPGQISLFKLKYSQNSIGKFSEIPGTLEAEDIFYIAPQETAGMLR